VLFLFDARVARRCAAATKARAGDACGGAEKFVPKKNLQNG
jgi:hypothetical protein